MCVCLYAAAFAHIHTCNRNAGIPTLVERNVIIGNVKRFNQPHCRPTLHALVSCMPPHFQRPAIPTEISAIIDSLNMCTHANARTFPHIIAPEYFRFGTSAMLLYMCYLPRDWWVPPNPHYTSAMCVCVFMVRSTAIARISWINRIFWAHFIKARDDVRPQTQRGSKARPHGSLRFVCECLRLFWIIHYTCAEHSVGEIMMMPAICLWWAGAMS